MGLRDKNIGKILGRLQQQGPKSAQGIIQKYSRIEALSVKEDGIVPLDLYLDLLKEAVELIRRIEAQSALKDERNERIQEVVRQQTDFLLRTVHHLRNPLHAVMGYVALVLRKTRDQIPEKQRENLEKALASADRLEVVIDQISDFLRSKGTV